MQRNKFGSNIRRSSSLPEFRLPAQAADYRKTLEKYFGYVKSQLYQSP